MGTSIGIKVTPNPARAGGTVKIKGVPGDKVLVGYKGKVRRLKLDSHGELEIAVPAEAGESFTVSDGVLPRPSNVVVKVISSGSVP